MRKRAGFARALVMEPDIVLFDEPDSGLDPVRTALLCELIKEVHAENGGCYVVITHDIMSARRVAEHISVLWKGRIVETGPAAGAVRLRKPVRAAVPVRRVGRAARHGVGRAPDLRSFTASRGAGGPGCAAARAAGRSLARRAARHRRRRARAALAAQRRDEQLRLDLERALPRHPDLLPPVRRRARRGPRPRRSAAARARPGPRAAARPRGVPLGRVPAAGAGARGRRERSLCAASRSSAPSRSCSGRARS